MTSKKCTHDKKKNNNNKITFNTQKNLRIFILPSLVEVMPNINDMFGILTTVTILLETTSFSISNCTVDKQIFLLDPRNPRGIDSFDLHSYNYRKRALNLIRVSIVVSLEKKKQMYYFTCVFTPS